jgi:hypothetical protein
MKSDFLPMKSIVLLLLVLLSGPSVGLTLDELQQSFSVKRLKIVDARETNLETLRKSYLAALERIQQKYEGAGRLDDALLSKKETNLVLEKTWPMPPLAESAARDLLSARKLFVRNHIDFQKKAGLSLVRAAEKMDELLAEKVVALTKEGDLASAKSARELQKTLQDDEALVAARALVQRVGNDGSSPVALRIRRAGDDLEVEVRYDSSGKISLQSPVENVVEITDGKKEKGTTTAKTLGEFIGGKGFKVDPYIALDEKFDDKEVGPIRFTSLAADFEKTDTGEMSLNLKVAANPLNIHASLGDCLPKLSEKGTYRIEIRYFVPKSNKFVNGMKFVQSEAGPLPGSLTLKTGEWDTFTVDMESGSETSRLLLYLNSKENVPQAQLVGESVQISHLQVSHQSMSAYLVQMFDRDGGQTQVNLEKATQTLFALNGDLVPKEQK